MIRIECTVILYICTGPAKAEPHTDEDNLGEVPGGAGGGRGGGSHPRLEDRGEARPGERSLQVTEKRRHLPSSFMKLFINFI